MDFNFRSYSAMLKLVSCNAWRYAGYDVIIGIPKSGIVPAVAMANILGLPFTTLNSAVRCEVPEQGFRTIRVFPGWNEAKILIVDDSVNNGNEVQRVKEIIKKLRLNAHIMAVYATTQGTKFVDSYVEILEHPRIFEWNLLNHSLNKQACFDMDGVLCVDPSSKDKENEDNYINFLENACPLFIPSKKIGYIVTSRLEKYRKLTEIWLKKHNVLYDSLIMMQHFDANTRQKYSLHAIFKSEIFRRTNTLYFVESSYSQAMVIARLAQKPCFCVHDMKMYISPQFTSGCEWVDNLNGIKASNEISSRKSRAQTKISLYFNKILKIFKNDKL